jgi:hypothetical protein
LRGRGAYAKEEVDFTKLTSPQQLIKRSSEAAAAVAKIRYSAHDNKLGYRLDMYRAKSRAHIEIMHPK